MVFGYFKIRLGTLLKSINITYEKLKTLYFPKSIEENLEK